jgi:protein-tyrosine phosphatase
MGARLELLAGRVSVESSWPIAGAVAGLAIYGKDSFTGADLVAFMTFSPAWLNDTYGGQRAFLRYLASRARATFVGHRDLERVDFSKVTRLVFVCKGNICRSPFAEYLARSFGISATSAGLEAQPGHPAYPRALEVASRRGVDLGQHRSRRFDEMNIRKTDLVVAFEADHEVRLRQGCGPGSEFQLTLIGLFASAQYGYLHDPYGLSERYFETCFSRIEDALRGLRARLDDVSRITGSA